jgi:translocation and assembly module TamB
MTTPPAPLGPTPALGRFRRVVGTLAATAGLTIVITCALVVSVAVHLDRGPTRRTVRAVANQILGSTFQGKIVVGEIDRLNLHGIVVRDARALDPRDAEVARLEGVRADVDVPAIVQSVLMGGGQLRVPIPLVHVDRADVGLDRGPNGVPGIAEAFLLRKPGPPPQPGAIPPKVTISRIEIDHVAAHGAIAPPVTVDAALTKVAGSVLVSAEGVDVDVGPVRLDARAPAPQPLAGDVRFRLHVPPAKPGEPPAPPRMEAGFDGRLGELDLSLAATMEGQHVNAKATVPKATPAVIASFLPDKSQKLPLRVPVSVVVKADGDLPQLNLDVSVELEKMGALAAAGLLSLTSPPTLDLSLNVRALDPRAVLEVPDATPLDAEGHVKLTLGAEPTIDASATTKPLTVAGTPIPGLKAHATLAHGEWKGGADVDEPGAPTTATFTMNPAQGLRFEVDSNARSLRAIRRLGLPLDGSARVKVAGTLKDGALDATVSGRVGSIRAPGEVELSDASIDGRVRGPLAGLSVDATVRGKGARAGRYAFDGVEAHASGTLGGAGGLRVETRLDNKDGESVEAKAALDPRAKSLRDVELKVKRGGGEIGGRVAAVKAGAGGVVVEGVALHGEGVGNLEGGLAVQGKEIVGKLHGHEVNLDRIARMVGLPLRVGGLANVEVDLASSRPGQRRGHIALELVDGAGAGLSGVDAQMAATFEGDHVRLDGLLRLVAHAAPGEKPDERCDGAIAAIRVSGGDGQLGGPLLDPNTWARASGKVEVAAEDWNLRCMARLAPVGLVLSEVRGKLGAKATIERRPGERLPSVRDLLARTRGLELAGLVDEHTEKPAWESRSMDVEIKGSFDAASGVTGARVALDDGSTIASVGGRATLDVPALLDHPEQRWNLLRKAPITMHVSVPRRAVGAFGTLPSFVRERLPPLAGDVEIDGRLEGFLDKPHVEVRASAWGLAHVAAEAVEPATAGRKAGDAVASKTPPLESPWELPIDGDVLVAYDGEKITASAHAKHDGKTILDAEGDLAVALADVLAGRPLRPKGELEAKLLGVPLGEIPYFIDRGIEGRVDGKVALKDIGTKPTLEVDLDLPGLKVGPDLAYDAANLHVGITRPKGRDEGPDRGTASARLEIASKKGGSFTVNADSAIVWQNGAIPTVDPQRPANLVATAKSFRIAVLGPFVAGLLSRVDGTLDGEALLGWTRLDDDDKAKIQVGMKLRDGLFHVPQLGQELHGAEVNLHGGAGGLVQIDGIQAYGTKGKLTGGGSVRFDGLRFTRADAEFVIKKGDELPLTYEGVPIGDAHGRITMNASKRGKDLLVNVGVPELYIDLPNSSGRNALALDANPDIVVLQEGVRRREPPPKDNSRMALTFDLGDIGVKSNIVDVGLSGVKGAPLKVEIADKARVSGDIQLTRGRIEVLHKQFEIEQGIVHMRPEDPGNPYLSVTARWDSTEGTIYIDYTGVLFPILPEKIKYRSPTIPEDKIMATLLFGGVEQSTMGTSGGGAPPGQALAAQLIAQQFSTQITGNISTSIGANDDGSFRPGLVYNSGDKVIELSTYGASGQGGTGGSALKGQRTQITVDWRFWRNWMLRGRVDAGSDQTTMGVDVLWQYRY